MRAFKYLGLLLCLAVVLCSCSKPGTTSSEPIKTSSATAQAVTDFSLMYCSRDSFDPYSCTTKQNFELSYLLYDSLVKLDNNFSPTFVLAETVTVSDKLCSIVLKSAKFSDGSAVTPDDVVFSFNKAKSSNTKFAYSLKNAVSATVTGNNSLSISLTKADRHFVNLLDFPVLKKGSDQLKNSDNKNLPPIGCGRYVLSEAEAALTVNTAYYRTVPSIAKITLIDAPDADAVTHNLEVGLVDYYYTDLSDNVIPQMNGKTAQVLLNNLVYIGVNHTKEVLSNHFFRQAISAAINRDDICTKAYFTNAVSAIGPYPTVWNESKGFQTIGTTANSSTAVQNIERAGYKNKDKNGFYKLPNGNRIVLSLLVNSNNSVRVEAANMIAASLKEVGIMVNVKSVPFNNYSDLLKNGDFDLYLAEVKIENNMDLTELVTKGGSASYTIGTSSGTTSSGTTSSKKSTSSSVSTSSVSSSSIPSGSSNNSSGNTSSGTTSFYETINVTTAQAVEHFYKGEYSVQDVITAFTAELPFIPVCYRVGLVVYNEKLPSFSPSESDLFFGFENIK